MDYWILVPPIVSEIGVSWKENSITISDQSFNLGIFLMIKTNLPLNIFNNYKHHPL